MIVHEYLELDLEVVYRALNRLNDFRKYMSFIENFLEKTSKGANRK
jgi:uncharacterized protein YutE (UPF0331/DUF86 family)